MAAALGITPGLADDIERWARAWNEGRWGSRSPHQWAAQLVERLTDWTRGRWQFRYHR